MVPPMSEEQLKAAVEPTEQVEEGVEEISEEDLAGVDGGGLAVMAPMPQYSGDGIIFID